MQWPKEAQIWLAASKDATRPPLNSVWFDGKSLTATDGCMLVRIPIEPDADSQEEPGFIPVDALKAGAKSRLSNATAYVQANEVRVLDTTFKRPTTDELGHFPETESLLANAEKIKSQPHYAICLNPEALVRLAKAMGGKGTHIRLRFLKGDGLMVADDPTEGEAIGIFMPMQFAPGPNEKSWDAPSGESQAEEAVAEAPSSEAEPETLAAEAPPVTTEADDGGWIEIAA